MLIGAYRDNEVDAAHPLARKLDVIRRAGARVHEIRLAPLTSDDLGQLIADALRCEPTHAAPLARLVHEKTAGNPFFVIQFLHALAEERLLHFDHDAARWSWDLDRIHAKGYTDNVVELMVGKLTRLPVETQHALQQLACLGNVAAIAMLPIVLGIPEDAGARGAVAGGPSGTGRATGRRLQIHARPGAGGRLFADPASVARRGPSPDRAAATQRRRRRRSGRRRSSRSSISSTAAPR